MAIDMKGRIGKQQADIAKAGQEGMAKADADHAETTGAVASVGSTISSIGGLIPGPVGAVAKIAGTATSLGAGIAGASRKGVTGAEAAGLAASTAGAVASSAGAVKGAQASPAAKGTVEAAANKKS